MYSLYNENVDFIHVYFAKRRIRPPKAQQKVLNTTQFGSVSDSLGRLASVRECMASSLNVWVWLTNLFLDLHWMISLEDQDHSLHDLCAVDRHHLVNVLQSKHYDTQSRGRDLFPS